MLRQRANTSSTRARPAIASCVVFGVHPPTAITAIENRLLRLIKSRPRKCAGTQPRKRTSSVASLERRFNESPSRRISVPQTPLLDLRHAFSPSGRGTYRPPVGNPAPLFSCGHPPLLSSWFFELCARPGVDARRVGAHPKPASKKKSSVATQTSGRATVRPTAAIRKLRLSVLVRKLAVLR